TPGNNTLRCTMSNGVSWDANERNSTLLDPGDAPNRWWVDINGDGLTDFCRVVYPGPAFACRLSRGDGDGTSTSAFVFSDVIVPNVNFGEYDGGAGFWHVTGHRIPNLSRVPIHRD